jgi:hypothetical protein
MRTCFRGGGGGGGAVILMTYRYSVAIPDPSPPPPPSLYLLITLNFKVRLRLEYNEKGERRIVPGLAITVDGSFSCLNMRYRVSRYCDTFVLVAYTIQPFYAHALTLITYAQISFFPSTIVAMKILFAIFYISIKLHLPSLSYKKVNTTIIMLEF